MLAVAECEVVHATHLAMWERTNWLDHATCPVWLTKQKKDANHVIARVTLKPMHFLEYLATFSKLEFEN